MSGIVARFVMDESGATAVEYSLIVGLIALFAAVGASALGNALNNEFNNAAQLLNHTAP
jgi:pilus assembly protein Flp/PilA